MCALFTATGDPPGTRMLKSYPSGFIKRLPHSVSWYCAWQSRVLFHFSMHNGTPHFVHFERAMHPQT